MRSRDTLLRLHRFRTAEKRRQAADLESMIQDFTRKFDDLDAQVKFEENRNGVSDPTHFNYSMAAKAARARRDNLMKSIVELREQLAEAKTAMDEAEAELKRAEMLAEKENPGSAALSTDAVSVPGLQAR